MWSTLVFYFYFYPHLITHQSHIGGQLRKGIDHEDWMTGTSSLKWKLLKESTSLSTTVRQSTRHTLRTHYEKEVSSTVLNILVLYWIDVYNDWYNIIKSVINWYKNRFLIKPLISIYIHYKNKFVLVFLEKVEWDFLMFIHHFWCSDKVLNILEQPIIVSGRSHPLIFQSWVEGRLPFILRWKETRTLPHKVKQMHKECVIFYALWT